MQKLIEKYRFWLFDLDDTIYLESDYIFQSYLQFSRIIAKKHHLEPQKIFDFLASEFTRGRRKLLFNRCKQKFNIETEDLEIFLNCLRNIKLDSPINIFPQINILFERLMRYDNKIIVVTNGNVIQQRNKVKYIKYNFYSKGIPIVFANEIYPKPAYGLFQYIKKKYDIIESKCIMVGDSETDMDFANNSGIDFLNISKIVK